MEQPAIRVEKLTLSRGGGRLLDDVSLTVGSGERVAIVGPNGAGKTTLLKCLLGLQRPDAGKVEVFGQPIGRYGRRELARQLSYVPQLLEASVPFTVLDFLMMGRYAHSGGFSNQDREGYRIARQALERIGMTRFAERVISTLSGGERQKICIAAALAQQAPVMVLDEPSAHLDPRQREEIHHILCEIGRMDGITILVVTHDLNWVAMDYDRMVGMAAGAVVADESPESFMSVETLERVFETRFLMHDHPETGRAIVIPPGQEGASKVKS